MKSTRVNLGARSYSITLGNISRELPLALAKLSLKPSRIFVVSSSAVIKAGHAARVVKAFSLYKKTVTLVSIPDGESHKNFKTLQSLYAAGLKAGLDRKSLVVAVGGGVITDLVGFFASTYMRGLSLISVPTTLLAMVDASIGGKTGVDLPQGKNLVGAFWQPSLVWIDAAVLKTLPAREWKTGMAETLKYGVIQNAPFFSWLEERVSQQPNVQRWTSKDLEKVLYVSACSKAEVVGGDERETPLAGGREILNFGHTIGHALEAATGYRRMTHGEAISVGMVVVGQMALQMGLWSLHDQSRLIHLISAFGLPATFPALSTAQKKIFWQSLQKDKKHVDGNLRFVLPVRMGKVEVRSGIPLSLVKNNI